MSGKGGALPKATGGINFCLKQDVQDLSNLFPSFGGVPQRGGVVANFLSESAPTSRDFVFELPLGPPL
jgi:hypothetical protein